MNIKFPSSNDAIAFDSHLADSIEYAKDYFRITQEWESLLTYFLDDTEYFYMMGALGGNGFIHSTYTWDRQYLIWIARFAPLEELPKLIGRSNGVGIFASIRLKRGV